MKNVLTPGLQVLKSTKLKKIRELPIKGSVLVKVGDLVNGKQDVCRADLPGDLRILRIPERMGIEVEEVLAGLKIKEGQSIQQGDVICEHSGLFGLLKTTYDSPNTGIVEFITKKTGNIGLRLPSKPLSLNAYVDGKVVSIVEEKSVEIEVSGSYIQGIFGVGGEKYGKLKVIAEANEKLSLDHLDNDIEGCILVGGKLPDFNFLLQAEKAGAIGLIAASITEIPLKTYLGYDLGLAVTGDEDIAISIIITEGFGDLNFSKRVYDLLKNLDGKMASINGATQVRAGAIRPEVLVSGDFSIESDVDSRKVTFESGLVVGQSIRIVRVPYFGERGEIVEMPNKKEVIDSGAKARILRAKLESGEVVTVPRVNVEIV